MSASKAAFRLRLDEKAQQKAKQIAEQEFRSLNTQLEYFIVKSRERFKRENGELPPAEDE